MTARMPGIAIGSSRLSRASQERLDQMVEETSLVGVARRIGIIPVTVERMLYGGPAKQESVAKVEKWMRVNL